MLTNSTLLTQYQESIAQHYSNSTVLAYVKDLKFFNDYLKEYPILNLTTEQLERYLAHLSTLTKKNGDKLFKESSLNRQRAALVSFYNVAIEKGWTKQNPASALKSIPKSEEKKAQEIEYLTKDESTRLLNHIKFFESGETMAVLRDYFMIRLVLNTGLSIRELKTLTLHQLDFEKGTVTVGEGDEKRVIPIPELVRDDLKADYEAYLEERDNVVLKGSCRELVFITGRGGSLTTQLANAALFKYSSNARLPKRVNNSMLRHTYAYNLIQAGVNIETVSKLLGHASPYFTEELYKQWIEAKQNSTFLDEIAI